MLNNAKTLKTMIIASVAFAAALILSPEANLIQACHAQTYTKESGRQQNKSKFYPNISRAAKRWSLNPRLLAGLIEQESRFKEQARSATGAVGLAQFTSIGCAEVRRLAGIRRYRKVLAVNPQLLSSLKTFNKQQAFHGATAIEAAALFLHHLMRTYKQNTAAALTHYNAGRKAALAVAKYGFETAKARGLLRYSQARVYAPEVLAKMQNFVAVLAAQ